jgi:acetyl-CoA synthetase
VKTFNFGYNIIDKRAAEFPDAIAVKCLKNNNFTLEISNADLHHHSDVTAYYLQKMGVQQSSRVLLCGLEKHFELAIILTALYKLCAVAVFDLTKNAVNCANFINAYAIISANNSPVIQQVVQNISNIKNAEVLISVGNPCPEYWFDFHTGVRFSKQFKPLKTIPRNYETLIIFDEKPQFFNENYPLETTTNFVWDKFYSAMRKNKVWIV